MGLKFRLGKQRWFRSRYSTVIPSRVPASTRSSSDDADAPACLPACLPGWRWPRVCVRDDSVKISGAGRDLLPRVLARLSSSAKKYMAGVFIARLWYIYRVRKFLFAIAPQPIGVISHQLARCEPFFPPRAVLSGRKTGRKTGRSRLSRAFPL